MEKRQLGVIVTSAEAQDEGVEAVLDRIARAGATAISPTIGVMAQGKPGDGSREPPGDVAGQVRVLDRPLWGQRVLYIKSYLPYEPDAALWAETGYAPPPFAPPELRVDVTRQLIDGARMRGMKAQIQISPYTLPGAPGGQSVGSGHGSGSLSERPRRVDQSIAERIVAGHGCLNNPRVRRLGQVRMIEALRHYPDIDGVFLDWAEYTSYFFEDCFTCFCAHCREAAQRKGYDWNRIDLDTRALWDRLHHLTNADVRRAADSADWPFALAGALVEYPGVADLLRFKAESVRDAAADLRQTMNAEGASGVDLALNGFAPPWNLVTGMHYGEVSKVVQETRCKLFTFHWPMITRWWSESLLEWNPSLDPNAVLKAVTSVLDLPAPANEHRQTIADYGMPRPDEPHPITMEALTRKVDQAVAMTAGRAPCLAYVHSYRPAEEFGRVLEAARASTAPGCWVQRYGYLSDEKVAIMAEIWRSS